MLISWNTTKECNLYCRHCYRDAGQKDPDELSTEEGKALLSEIAHAGFKIMVFSGGEPLLRKDIYELIGTAKKLGLRPVLGTNGTLIDKIVAQKLKQAGCLRAGISLDSIDTKTHDEFRNQKGAWQKSVNAMKACKDAGLDFQVHTTVTKNNYREIEKICDFALNLGAKAYHVFFLIAVGRAKEKDIYLSPKQHEKLLHKILEKQKTMDMELKPVCAPQFMRIARDMGINLRFERGCLAGISYCCILPNGDVHPCPYLPLKVGNVRNVIFSKIWQESPVFRDLRKQDYKGKCAACVYKKECGGCRAVAFYEKKDYLAEDGYCLYANKRQKITA